MSVAMKKLVASGVVVCAIMAGVLIYIAAPYLASPSFLVVNEASESVFVTAYWRDKEMIIGSVQPSKEARFSVKDEAAMRFSARYTDGRVVESEEIYFTSGTIVIAEITNSGIKVKYDFDT